MLEEGERPDPKSVGTPDLTVNSVADFYRLAKQAASDRVPSQLIQQLVIVVHIMLATVCGCWWPLIPHGGSNGHRYCLTKSRCIRALRLRLTNLDAVRCQCHGISCHVYRDRDDKRFPGRRALR